MLNGKHYFSKINAKSFLNEISLVKLHFNPSLRLIEIKIKMFKKISNKTETNKQQKSSIEVRDIQYVKIKTFIDAPMQNHHTYYDVIIIFSCLSQLKVFRSCNNIKKL